MPTMEEIGATIRGKINHLHKLSDTQTTLIPECSLKEIVTCGIFKIKHLYHVPCYNYARAYIATGRCFLIARLASY